MLSNKAKRELKIDQRQILIDSIEIGISSPQQICLWGSRQLPNGKKVGLVKNSKTVNYKRFTPFRDGLFCERIFGPVTSFVCACGKKQPHSKVTFCEKCEVEYIDQRSRRYRLGYISLLSPVTHIWYLKGRPSYLSLFLGKRKKTIVALAYCNAYLIELSYFKKDNEMHIWPFMSSHYNPENLLQHNLYKSSSNSSCNGLQSGALYVQKEKQSRRSITVLPVAPAYKAELCTQRDAPNHVLCKPKVCNGLQLCKGTYVALAKRSFASASAPLCKMSTLLPLCHVLCKAELCLHLWCTGKVCNAEVQKGSRVGLQSGALYASARTKLRFVKSTFFANRRFACTSLQSGALHAQGLQSGALHAQASRLRFPFARTKLRFAKNVGRFVLGRFVRTTNSDQLLPSYKSSFKRRKLENFVRPCQTSGVPANRCKTRLCVRGASKAELCKERGILGRSCKREAESVLQSGALQRTCLRQALESFTKPKNFEEKGVHFSTSYSAYSYVRHHALPFLPTFVSHFYLRDALLHFIYSSAAYTDIPLMEYCQNKRLEPLQDVHKLMARQSVDQFKTDLPYVRSLSSCLDSIQNRNFSQRLKKTGSSNSSYNLKTEVRSYKVFKNCGIPTRKKRKVKTWLASSVFAPSYKSELWAHQQATGFISFVRKVQRTDAKLCNANKVTNIIRNIKLIIEFNKKSFRFQNSKIFHYTGIISFIYPFILSPKIIEKLATVNLYLRQTKKYNLILFYFWKASINFNQKYFKSFVRQDSAQTCVEPTKQKQRAQKIKQVKINDKKDDLSLTNQRFVSDASLSHLELTTIREILSYTGGGALQQLLQQFDQHDLCKFLFAEKQILRVLYQKHNKFVLGTDAHTNPVCTEGEKGKRSFIPHVPTRRCLQTRRESRALFTPRLANQCKPSVCKGCACKPSVCKEVHTSLQTEGLHAQPLQSGALHLLSYPMQTEGLQSRCLHLLTKRSFVRTGEIQKGSRIEVTNLCSPFGFGKNVPLYAQNHEYVKVRTSEVYTKFVKQAKRCDLQKKQVVRVSRRIYKVARRLKVVQLLTLNHRRPEWMILSHLPVLPPDLRPILQMSEKVIVASDLNIMYQRVIYRNNRHLRVRFIDFHLVTAIQRLVQDAVDRLIENGKGGSKPYYTQGGRPLKSLSDILKGKKGRFRLNLLGKRVDFSGRSVIVVAPTLKIHECGLPKDIALELYHYFLLRQLIVKKYCASIVTAKKMIKSKSSLMWNILRELMYHHPVLLNRAPTLHRLGIQAFQPKLVLGNAIWLHPLVCSGFNADFDGDQMGVHLPLSFAARAESWDLLWSRNNLLSPATGQPMLVPSQDMVLGFYYMTAKAISLLPTEQVKARSLQSSASLLHLPSQTNANLRFAKRYKQTLYKAELCTGSRALRTKLRFVSRVLKTVSFQNKNSLFLNTGSIITSLQNGVIKLHTPVWLYWNGGVENENVSQLPLELRVHTFGIQRYVYEKYINSNLFKKTKTPDYHYYKGIYDKDKLLKEREKSIKVLPFYQQHQKCKVNFVPRAKHVENKEIFNVELDTFAYKASLIQKERAIFSYFICAEPKTYYIRTTAGRVLMNTIMKV